MKRVVRILLDIIDLYVPTITFIIMFLAFIVQVVFRYVPMLRPLPWAYDVTIFAFIWTTLLAACHVRRIGRHIKFDMFYLSRSELTRTLFRLISNSLVLLACAVSFMPTLSYLTFIHGDKSPVLRIPMSLGYGPIIVFIFLIGCYSAQDIVLDIKELVSEINESHSL